MRHLLTCVAVLMTVTSCQLAPQKTDPLAVLETIEGLRLSSQQPVLCSLSSRRWMCS